MEAVAHVADVPAVGEGQSCAHGVVVLLAGASVEGLTGILYAYKPYTDALKTIDDLERLERLIPQARVLFSEANILYKG